jgi:hypothetical protein
MGASKKSADSADFLFDLSFIFKDNIKYNNDDTKTNKKCECRPS